MTEFADIHIHMLHHVDDGAKSPEEMKKMLELSYADGVRTICLTPHFHPGFFGDNRTQVEEAYRELEAYVLAKHPDVRLALGNELRYSPNCIEWLHQGFCRTINHTEKILVDFSQHVERQVFLDAVYRLLNGGYTPVLAHVERYEKLHWDLREIIQTKECGAVIQVDSGSLFGAWGFQAKQRSRRLLGSGIADLVCSDAHDCVDRPPQLSPAYEFVEKRSGREYAESVFRENALRILGME